MEYVVTPFSSLSLSTFMSWFKRIFIVLVLLFPCLAMAITTNRIFLLDTSASMNKDNLFGKIKESLRENYISKMNVGEHIVILTFDDSVRILVDKTVQSQEDINEITRQIDNLRAGGKWTWLTSSLSIALQQASRLRASFPDRDLNIYVLTDGKNEPPPGIPEPGMELEETLSKYMKEISAAASHTTVISFPVDSSVTRTNTFKGLDPNLALYEKERTATDPLLPEVEIAFSVTNLIEADCSVDHCYIADGELLVQTVRGQATGEMINLAVNDKSVDSQANVSTIPTSFVVDRPGQNVPIRIEIKSNRSLSEFQGELLLTAKEFGITPNSFPVIMSVTPASSQQVVDEKTSSNVLQRETTIRYGYGFLIGTILLFSIYLVVLYVRTKQIWVRNLGNGSQISLIISGLRRTPLTRVGIDEYMLGWGKGLHNLFSIYAFSDRRQPEKISMNKELVLQGKQDEVFRLFISNHKLDDLD